ncbi:MAG: hypothetical protein ABJC39_05080 [Chloroflexota bacterium]
MVRFFLLRFLPRRLVPLLFVVEIFRLVQGWRKRNDPVVDPRRKRAVAGYRAGAAAPHQSWTDRRG